MDRRRLGNSDVELTTIGLGTWAIGGGDWKFGWGPQDEDAAVEAIVRGVELGINWIDTAAVYGKGRSEELVARALKRISPSQRPVVATKCGRIIQPDGNIIGVLKRQSVLAECEASLKRLQVESIDLYQLHWPDPDVDIEEAWSTLIDLKRQGKVRHIGVSNHSPRQMARLQDMHPIASLQPPYSMLARDIEAETLACCREQGIGVVCYSPMCKGLLTGQFSRQRAAQLDPSDHRTRDPRFQSPLLDENLDFVESLKPLANRVGRSVAQLAIAWTLRRPEVTSAIVGVRRPDQIESTAPAGDWRLPTDLIAEIERLLPARK
jgi:aryl-alcohol dehydrogenase-like predicted oxidoreductase